MTTSAASSWEHFKKNYRTFPSIKLALDISRISISTTKRQLLEAKFAAAFEHMKALEAGAISNPDENRMVGHYWLRTPELSPAPEIRREIEQSLACIKDFVSRVHAHTIQGARGPFKNLLVVGIGGSALGPQLAAHALGNPTSDRLKPFFFDNTDPDGIDRTLAMLQFDLGQTLVIVISKSGGTKETYNGMVEVTRAYEAQGLSLTAHAIAITGVGSKLDQHASAQKWLQRFPMWDWVGGRTSETSVVGLLPAALQGVDIDSFLAGARACDALTRLNDIDANPAALLALAWHVAGEGKGSKDMVILPYKDRLELMSKYLQQLVMESLGKELDLDKNRVEQGIAVYGNKGSTDQHAYIQQLRDGLHNFFVTFIEVLKDRSGKEVFVGENVTSGDYLQGFYLGTRTALHAKGRESITLTLHEVSPFSLGVLIALYERAVGLYAHLVHINAYHQPGVEAGKVAAEAVIALQAKVLTYLRNHPNQSFTIDQLAAELGAVDSAETLFKLLTRLAANPSRGIRTESTASPFETRYRLE